MKGRKPLTVYAEDNNNHANRANNNNNVITRNVTTGADVNDNNMNWEWLGLLGLVGLALEEENEKLVNKKVISQKLWGYLISRF